MTYVRRASLFRLPSPRIFVSALVVGTTTIFVGLPVHANGAPTTGALTYLGYLETPDGTPVNGSKNIQLALYDQEADGSKVCEVPSDTVTPAAGRFQIPLPDDCTRAVQVNPDLWVELQVDGASLGRAKLGAVPYAIEAIGALRAVDAVGDIHPKSITTDGNIGVGTTTPNRGGASGNFKVVSLVGPVGGIIELCGDTNTTLPDTEIGEVDFRNGSILTSSIAGYAGGSDSGYLGFSTKASGETLAERLRITGGGDIGIGTTTPSFTLHVNGSAGKPGGGSWTDSSDVRLKKNVTELTGVLDRLLQLRGVSFEWKEPEKHGNLRGAQIGMIAQEVEKVFPDWVGTDPDGFKTLGFRGFEALTVESLRTIKLENDGLRARVSNLEDRVHRLEREHPRVAEGSVIGRGWEAATLGLVLLWGLKRRRAPT